MHIFVSFILLVVGNVLIADWATTRYLVKLWTQLVYGPWLYLYLPVGAYFLICTYDATRDVNPTDRRNGVLLYLSPVAYLVFVMVLTGGHPKGGETVLMLPIAVIYPVGALLLVLSLFAVLAMLPMFYRAIIGASVPRHPAHALIRAGNIEPEEAADLAASIRDSMQETLGLSPLQIDIRNKRYSILLRELSEKVDSIATENQRREAEQRAEAERLARPERERLEALARAANLDAELTKKIIDLVRENERKRRTGG